MFNTVPTPLCPFHTRMLLYSNHFRPLSLSSGCVEALGRALPCLVVRDEREDGGEAVMGFVQANGEVRANV